MVSEGEDWQSVEVPTAGGSSAPILSATDESRETEQPSGGNSKFLTHFK